MQTMNNDRFDDIGVLTILQQLRKQDLLHDEDRDALMARLKSDWGKQAAHAIITGNDEMLEQRPVLRRFSAAF
jgi:hypothetical protein